MEIRFEDEEYKLVDIEWDWNFGIPKRHSYIVLLLDRNRIFYWVQDVIYVIEARSNYILVLLHDGEHEIAFA